MDQETTILLLELQNEELLAIIEKLEEECKRAKNRAQASERQNKKTREKKAFAEADLQTISQCWNCPDLGKKDICNSCSNNHVFTKIDSRYEWRGYPQR